jgi:hypothetical protein
MTDLTEIETQYGFTFGTPEDHDTASAPKAGILHCANPDCSQINKGVEYHADTVLPIHCGSCSTVLLCEHDWEPVETLDGTLAAPVKVTHDRCSHCGTVANIVTTALDPIDLNDLPLSTIHTILSAPAATVPKYTEQ